jgi:predicted lactoylglutathione lyase
MIFINLPVTDLNRSIGFYEAIGATRNPDFSNEQAAMMVLSDTIHVMLLTHSFYSSFTAKPIADARATSQVLLCLSADSREAVDELLSAVSAAGGRTDLGLKQEQHDFMYGRDFEDPDGHSWEVMWMDPAAMQAAPQPVTEEA